MRFVHLPAAIERFGMAGTLKLLTSRRRLRSVLPSWTENLTIRDYPFPFYFRHATTDKYAIVEVLLHQQYGCLRDLRDVATIVDAGANIGTTSVFLLNTYTSSRLFALEPDPSNFEVLQRNLRPYGARAIALRRALWHRPESLRLERGKFRDGGAWSIQVKPTDLGVTEVEGTTIGAFMSEHSLSSIDILKIDIEGAERHIFEETASEWLGRVGAIAIELHDSDCRSAFVQATACLSGDMSQHGEVTFWRRRQ